MNEFIDIDDGEEHSLEEHYRVVDGVIVALGLLGHAEQYEQVYCLLPEEVQLIFAREAILAGQTNETDRASIDRYLTTALAAEPFVPAIIPRDGMLVLSKAGTYRFRTLISSYALDPDSFPTVGEIMGKFINQK